MVSPLERGRIRSGDIGYGKYKRDQDDDHARDVERRIDPVAFEIADLERPGLDRVKEHPHPLDDVKRHPGDQAQHDQVRQIAEYALENLQHRLRQVCQQKLREITGFGKSQQHEGQVIVNAQKKDDQQHEVQAISDEGRNRLGLNTFCGRVFDILQIAFDEQKRPAPDPAVQP